MSHWVSNADGGSVPQIGPEENDKLLPSKVTAVEVYLPSNSPHIADAHLIES